MAHSYRFLPPAVVVLVSIALMTMPRATSEPVFPLKSTAVTLPAGNLDFPNGPGLEQVAANCVACHSPEMILNQPRLSKTTWDAEVHKMINVYKAPIAEADVAPIVDYLVATKGIK